MSAFKGKKQSPNSTENNAEVRLRARSVSRGVAIGNVVSLYGEQRQFYKIRLDDSVAIEKEIRRFRAAIRLAGRQLKKISEKKTGVAQQAHIFDVHLLILEDKSYLSQIESVIAEKKVNAEWAVKTVTDAYKARYKNISDEYLRERYVDLLDVSGQILTALDGGRGKAQFHLEKDSIIVAKEVKPSTLIELFESNPKAIVAERGGWTSHTFILAREMNLPAVTGSAGFVKRVKNGDKMIVDGYNGQVIIHPSAETVRNYAIAAAEFEKFDGDNLEDANQAVKTLDGREVIVRANLDLPDGYEQAKRSGAQGIGLYRSEYLFNQYKGFPTESDQTEVYRQIAETVGENGVRIRTFDLSAEQFAGDSGEKEKNPALGLRAIRFSLRYKKQFRVQIRAILQASYQNKIDIIVPMISDVAEVIEIKKIIKSEKTSLIKKGIKLGEPLVGAMIEVPAAVFTIEEIASEVDFLCLGTNDLVQYLLAVDRDNEAVAEWFQTLHPAVLRAIKKVLTAAEDARIPAIICGEMAGSPFYAPILIGLGATELSMYVNSLPRVRKVLNGIAFEEARAVVGKIEKCRTASEVELVVRQNIRDKWTHLFSAEF
jgi:phosphotransferase system enzyme I (PtsI)